VRLVSEIVAQPDPSVLQVSHKAAFLLKTSMPHELPALLHPPDHIVLRSAMSGIVAPWGLWTVGGLTWIWAALQAEPRADLIFTAVLLCATAPVGLLIGTAIGAYNNRREQQRVQALLCEATRRWNDMHYCARDNVVFVRGVSGVEPVLRARYLLYPTLEQARAAHERKALEHSSA
jgi:hypothetical protein